MIPTCTSCEVSSYFCYTVSSKLQLQWYHDSIDIFTHKLILILVEYNMNKSLTKNLAQSKEKDWIAIRSDQIFQSA